MAIDTLAKRRRALSILPIANGDIEAIDRSQVSKFYYVGTEVIPIINYEKEKDEYIQLCGLEQPIRFHKDKLIDLFKFVPQYQKQTNFSVLVKELNDYFNSMYDGNNSFYYTEEDI
jgi:hypothetical protein